MLHLNGGDGREVCRSDPVRPGNVTDDISKVDCPICQRVLRRSLMERGSLKHFQPRCVHCKTLVDFASVIYAEVAGLIRICCKPCEKERRPPKEPSESGEVKKGRPPAKKRSVVRKDPEGLDPPMAVKPYVIQKEGGDRGVRDQANAPG